MADLVAERKAALRQIEKSTGKKIVPTYKKQGARNPAEVEAEQKAQQPNFSSITGEPVYVPPPEQYQGSTPPPDQQRQETQQQIQQYIQQQQQTPNMSSVSGQKVYAPPPKQEEKKPSKIQGTYTIAPTKTYEPTILGGISKLSDYLTEKKERAQFSADFREGSQLKKYGLVLAAGGVGAISYGVQHPIKTAALVAGTIFAPEVTGLYVASEFYRNPEMIPTTPEKAVEFAGGAAVFAGVTGITYGGLKYSGAPTSFKGLFAKTEIKGATTQKGRTTQIKDKSITETIGKFEGVAETTYTINIFGKKIKLGESKIEPVGAEVQYTGSGTEFDIGIKGSAGKKIAAGRGLAQVTEGSGAEMFDILVKEPGKNIEYTRGVRSYEIKTGEPEIAQISQPEYPFKEITYQQGDFRIQAISKEQPTQAVKIKGGFEYEEIVGEFPDVLEYQVGKKGKLSSYTDVGAYAATKETPLTAKGKQTDIVFVPVESKMASFPKKITSTTEEIIPESFKETFDRVGVSAGGKVSKADQAALQKQLEKFLPQKKTYPTAGIYGLDLFAPEVTFKEYPKIQTSTTPVVQAGTSARLAAETIARSGGRTETGFSFVPIISFEGSAQSSNSVPIEFVEIKRDISPINEVSLKNEIKQEIKTSNRSESISRTETTPAIKSEVISDIKPDIKQEIKTDLKTEPKITPQPPPTIRPSIIPGFPDNQRKQSRFTVLVRRSGVFRPIGETSELGTAFALGKRKVASTAAASFKIISFGSETNIRSSARKFLSPGVFRESKREPGVFVQRRSKRISSAGEKREITFKGIFSQKVRRSRRFTL